MSTLIIAHEQATMTAYRKNILTWVCIITVELIIGACGIYESKWFLAPFFMLILLVPAILRKIVCPNCGTPVTYQGTVAGLRIQGGFIRKNCQQCGWNLDRTR